MSSEVPPEYPTYFNCDGVSERCPVEATLFGDYFNKGACLFFAITFANLLAAQSYLGWRLKSKLFVFTLACGTILELMGYIARVIMVSNPWNFPALIIQNTGLTLAPTMIAIANSVTFKHLVLYYGERWSFIKAKNYPLVFVWSDGMCLGVQSVGGVLAATATGTQNQFLSNIGNNLMLAGICLQVVNMVFCGGLILSYAWRRRFNTMDLVVAGGSGHGSTSLIGEGSSPLYVNSTKTERRRAKFFVHSLVVAYLAIVIRCAYRIPEMAMGWGSDLQRNEKLFLVLDGAMILLSVFSMTAFHPTLFFPFMGPPVEGATCLPSSASTSENVELTSRTKR